MFQTLMEIAMQLALIALVCPTRLAKSALLCLSSAVMLSQSACTESRSSDPFGTGAAPASEATTSIDSSLVLGTRDSLLQVGQQNQLRVTDPAFTAAQRRRFLASPVGWSSSDSTVVSVTQSGTVTANSEGRAVIRALWQNRAGYQAFLVTAVHSDTSSPPAPEPPSAPPPLDPGLLAGSPAELPRDSLILPTVEGGGTLHRVRSGERVQPAIDRAKRGDVIVLEAGATFPEQIILRKKPGAGWITIRTEGVPTLSGRRVQLSDTVQFARIHSPTTSSSLRTDPEASGYWLINLHISANPTATSVNTLVSLGSADTDQSTYGSVPRNLVIDRSILRGRPDLPLRRCVALHSAFTAVVNSLLLECHELGADSQAIASWNGPGPFLIENNTLEGAGQNIMFGGAHPQIYGLHPADIIIRWNHIRRPPEWLVSKRWTMKGSVQFKHAQRVLVEHNVIENGTGSAVVASSTNQGGGPTVWAETHNITLVSNVIRNTGRAVTFTGLGGAQDAGFAPMTNAFIANNAMYRLGDRSGFPSANQRAIFTDGIVGLHIINNTIDGTQTAVALTSSQPTDLHNFVMRANIASFGDYGFFGSGGGGLTSIKNRYRSFVFAHNCFYDIRAPQRASAVDYPAPNILASGGPDQNLPGLANDDISVSAQSACRVSTNGRPIGASPALVSFLEQRAVGGLGAP